MKKTVIVNINGIIFHIDEDAYEKLNIYLDTLKRYFSATTEDKEIVEDIEARISELMQPKISEAKQSISIDDIEEIIGILGNPEDIAGGTEAKQEKQSYSTYQEPFNTHRGSRRLYRDIDSSILGGVCSGMAAYFNIDPIIFRIIFIAFIFSGVSLIIYPILWIVLPAAITSAQKLEMRGKDVNISNIERQVRDEYARVKNNISNINTQSVGGKMNNFLHELFRALGGAIRAFAIFLKYILAVVFIIAAIGIFVGVIAAFYFNSFAIDEPLLGSFNSIQEILTSIVDPFTASLLLILGLFIIALPCVALIYYGLKMLIRFKAEDKYVSIGLSVVWLGAIITFVAVIFNQFKNFKYESTGTQIVQLQKPSRNMLYIEASGIAREDIFYRHHFAGNGLFGIERKNGKDEIIAPVTIYIEKAKGNELYIEIEKMGRGATFEDAATSLKSVSVYTNQVDTILNIDPFFRLRAGERWKFNRTKIIVYLPEGMNIRFSRSIEPFMYEIQNHYWDDNDISSEAWQMKATGMHINQQQITESFPLQHIGHKPLHVMISDKYPLSSKAFATKKVTRTISYRRFGKSYTEIYDITNHSDHSMSYNGRDYKYATVSLDILKSNTSQMRIDIIKTVPGLTKQQSENKSIKLLYGFIQEDSILKIDPIYLIPETEKIRKYNVSIKIYLPEGSKLYLDQNLYTLYKEDYWLNKPLQIDKNGDLQTI